MREVSPGDVVFSFSDTRIKAIALLADPNVAARFEAWLRDAVEIMR